MSLPQVTINVTNGNGRRAPGTDHISGLVLGAVDVSGSGNFDVGTVYEFNSLKDAEDIGLTAAYDLAEGILVHHHIARFFKRCPGGTLYVLGVTQGTTLAQMCDKTLTYAKSLITQAQGKIKQLGVVLNPDMGSYSPTLTTGIDADVIAAIPKAQALAVEALADKRPLVVIIEGRELNGSIGSVLDLRAKNAPYVGVTIAQDKAVADADAAFADYAAVGDTLGIMAKVKVSQSLGNRKLPVCQLQDAADDTFTQACLSSGVNVEDVGFTNLGVLYGKGFITPTNVSNLPGYYLAGSPSCTLVTSDFNFLEYSRTMNKAVRLVDAVYATEVNADRLINDDGTLQTQELGDLEAAGENALQPMKEATEISNCNAYIDPAQDVNATGEIDIEIGVTPVGTTRNLTINIGYGLINA